MRQSLLEEACTSQGPGFLALPGACACSEGHRITLLVNASLGCWLSRPYNATLVAG